MHNQIQSLTLPSALELSKIEIHAKSGHMGPYSAQFAGLLALIRKQEAALASQPAQPAVTETGLPELRDLLKISAVFGDPITLSSASAGALYYAMSTGEPAATTQEIRAVANSPEFGGVVSSLEIPDSSKAQPAATVDAPEFRELLGDVYMCPKFDFLNLNDASKTVIAHIDAHTAAAVAAAVAESNAAHAKDISIMFRELQEAKCAAAPQPAQVLSDDQIEAIYLANGFAVKEGHAGLKAYVFRAARDILAASQQPAAVPDQSVVIGFPDPNAVFAAFCDREGYPSDGDMDEPLRKAFWEAVRMFSGDIPAAAPVQAAVVPEGYVLVPKEPTIEMIAALGWGGDETLAVGHAFISKGIADDYARLLAAAPSAPSPAPVQPECFLCHGTGQYEIPTAVPAGVEQPPPRMAECQQCKKPVQPADAAPVEAVDERAAFENWIISTGRTNLDLERIEAMAATLTGRYYKWANTEEDWKAWQARAALAAPSEQVKK